MNTAFIKDLASACSTQAQVANRTWIALMTVSVIAVLPRSSSSGADFQVPLGLGTVDPAWFNVVMLALLTVLAIAFSAAYAQQFRAKRLAQMQLNKLPTVDEGNVHIHPRDFFDALLIPSVNRVAPIAQLYLGLDNFYSSPVRAGIVRRGGAMVYYLLLKLASWLVYFAFPVAALWTCFVRTHSNGPQLWLFVAVGVIATATVVHSWVVDICGMWDVLKAIGLRKETV